MKIAFGATGYGALWAPPVASWLRAVAFAARTFAVENIGDIGGCGVTDRTYTTTAQNQLVKDMLANKEFTHLFLTEIDMILPHDTITKFAALDKDMVSGVYYLRSDLQLAKGQPCLYQKADLDEAKRQYHREMAEYLCTGIQVYPRAQPFKLEGACGVGCILIKRAVFETLKDPWFQIPYNNENGHGLGSDMFFHGNARMAGFELWIDPTVQCGQIDYYVTDVSDYEWRIKNDPEFAKRGFIVGKS